MLKYKSKVFVLFLSIESKNRKSIVEQIKAKKVTVLKCSVVPLKRIALLGGYTLYRRFKPNAYRGSLSHQR